MSQEITLDLIPVSLCNTYFESLLLHTSYDISAYGIVMLGYMYFYMNEYQIKGSYLIKSQFTIMHKNSLVP